MRRRAPGTVKWKLKRVCQECGEKFETNRRNKIYCKTECQFKAWSKKNPRKTIRITNEDSK